MNLSEIGEFKLIDKIKTTCGDYSSKNIFGIGDDCAVIPKNERTNWLISTDSLVENTHFLLGKSSPEDLAYKSLAVNLSDIAAMGGIPEFCLLSLALPPRTSSHWIDTFVENFVQTCAHFNIILLGGDTCSSKNTAFINIAITGNVSSKHIKYRSTAKPRDILVVTGNLGDSAAGLHCLLNDIPTSIDTTSFIKHHLRPEPHLGEAQWLAQHQGVHAMIDISDGLDSDLKQILQASQCGCCIELNQLPLSSYLKNAPIDFGCSVQDLACSGGEDYCLLCSIAPNHFDTISRSFESEFNRPLFPIGTITSEVLDLCYTSNGKTISPKLKSFQHFIL